MRLDEKPVEWEDRIVLFVGFLVKEGKQSSTIRSYLSALRSILKIEGVKLNEDLYLLNALTRVCKLKNDTLRTRLPIKRSLVLTLIEEIRKLFSKQPYLAKLYTALLSTTYMDLFRVGEVTESSHVLKAADVQIASNKKKLKSTLWTSKTHNRGNKPQVIKIKSEPIRDRKRAMRTWCPFECVREFLEVRNKEAPKGEQFFIFEEGAPVKPADFNAILKTCLLNAGYCHELFSVHSLCAGRALELLEQGVSVETIKKIGRWKSNAVFAYLKQW